MFVLVRVGVRVLCEFGFFRRIFRVWYAVCLLVVVLICWFGLVGSWEVFFYKYLSFVYGFVLLGIRLLLIFYLLLERRVLGKWFLWICLGYGDFCSEE